MMIKGDYSWCQDIAQSHACSEHPDLSLVVAWDKEQGWVIRCGGGHFPTLLQRLMSYTEEFKHGEPVPIAIVNKIERRLGIMENELDKKQGEQTPRLPAIYEASDGSMVRGDLRLAAIEYARAVGLIPELGHVCLYFGKPWVTIDGWYYRFRQKFPEGRIASEPLPIEARQALHLEDDLQAWTAAAYDKDSGNRLSIGYGYAREGEEPLARKSAVEPRWPWRLAEKRAEEDALRKVVPLEIEGKEG